MRNMLGSLSLSVAVVCWLDERSDYKPSYILEQEWEAKQKAGLDTNRAIGGAGWINYWYPIEHDVVTSGLVGFRSYSRSYID